MVRTESLACSRESTILTTDVVSTALLRRYPNDMMGAMDLHDQILHAAIRRRSGDPFRHIGDGVLAIFERPRDAVLAAIDAQREMRGAALGSHRAASDTVWHPHGPDAGAGKRLLRPCPANGHAVAERRRAEVCFTPMS